MTFDLQSYLPFLFPPRGPNDISRLRKIGGFRGGCLVDSVAGEKISTVEMKDDNSNFAAVSSANSEAVRAKTEALKTLKLDDTMEDVLISYPDQYHIVRPLQSDEKVFLYVALDRKSANLDRARRKMKSIESQLGR
ncbi:MAG: roadblock/LC7 domain-containing protein [Pseudomonadota bacterium]